MGEVRASIKIRCRYCGKFIKYGDFENALAFSSVTPDTHFSTEEITYAHRTCFKNKELTWSK